MTDVQRRTGLMRASRALFTVVLLADLAACAQDLAAGKTGLAVMMAVAVILVAATIVLHTLTIRRVRAGAQGAGLAGAPQPSARERVLRRVASRPRRTMTPGDYRRLRELERGLGWEPSEPCMPVEVPEPISPGMAALGGAGSVSDSQLRGAWSTSGSAREWRMTATEKERRDVAEGAVHFAQLARAGRESCVSPCRLCEARDRHYPTAEGRALLAAKLAGFKDDASLRDWIEKGRWG